MASGGGERKRLAQANLSRTTRRRIPRMGAIKERKKEGRVCHSGRSGVVEEVQCQGGTAISSGQLATSYQGTLPLAVRARPCLMEERSASLRPAGNIEKPRLQLEPAQRRRPGASVATESDARAQWSYPNPRRARCPWSSMDWTVAATPACGLTRRWRCGAGPLWRCLWLVSAADAPCARRESLPGLPPRVPASQRPSTQAFSSPRNTQWCSRRSRQKST